MPGLFINGEFFRLFSRATCIEIGKICINVCYISIPPHVRSIEGGRAATRKGNLLRCPTIVDTLTLNPRPGYGCGPLGPAWPARPPPLHRFLTVGRSHARHAKSPGGLDISTPANAETSLCSSCPAGRLIVSAFRSASGLINWVGLLS